MYVHMKSSFSKHNPQHCHWHCKLAFWNHAYRLSYLLLLSGLGVLPSTLHGLLPLVVESRGSINATNTACFHYILIMCVDILVWMAINTKSNYTDA